jgi:hypothetical protein
VEEGDNNIVLSVLEDKFVAANMNVCTQLLRSGCLPLRPGFGAFRLVNWLPG